MVCPKCKGIITHDEYSHSYYCEKCKHLYGEDEIKEAIKHKGTLKRWQLVSLMILMCIPIINLIVLLLILNSKIKLPYKDICTVIMVIWTLIYATTMIFTYVKIDEAKGLLTANGWLPVAEKFMYKPAEPEKIIIKEKPDTVVVEYVNYDQSYYDALDDVIIQGSKVIDLMEADESMVYLYQTNKMIEKNGIKSIRNIGTILTETYKTENGVYYLNEDFYDKISDTEFVVKTNDFGEAINVSLTYITESKLIFNIEKKDYFKCNVIRDKDNSIIGLSFLCLNL